MTRSIQIICSSLEELDQAITAENAASLDEIFQSFSNMNKNESMYSHESKPMF